MRTPRSGQRQTLHRRRTSARRSSAPHGPRDSRRRDGQVHAHQPKARREPLSTVTGLLCQWGFPATGRNLRNGGEFECLFRRFEDIDGLLLLGPDVIPAKDKGNIYLLFPSMHSFQAPLSYPIALIKEVKVKECVLFTGQVVCNLSLHIRTTLYRAASFYIFGLVFCRLIN